MVVLAPTGIDLVCVMQVRGLRGVDCQWIALSKDWQEAKRRRKENEHLQRQNTTSKKGKAPATEKPTEGHPEPDYSADMDEMRCMLYFHGGGYYFGSIDQERYASFALPAYLC